MVILRCNRKKSQRSLTFPGWENDDTTGKTHQKNHQTEKLVYQGSSCILVLGTIECEVTPGYPREGRFKTVLET